MNNKDTELAIKAQQIESKRIETKIKEFLSKINIINDFLNKSPKKAYSLSLNQDQMEILNYFCKENNLTLSKLVQLIINNWWNKDE